MSNNNEKDDNLTVSRLYNTLKSPTFLKTLYWDILSNIKEKNTYKFMRGMAESLINQHMEVLNGLNDDEADNNRRKAIVAEICAMSYAIDTVFSKILYLKLEKVCKGQILNIIQQLRDEKKIPESVWSKFEIKTEPEASIDNSVVKTDSAYQKKKVQKTPSRVERRKRKVNSSHSLQDIKKANSNKDILEDLKKVNGTMETDADKNSNNSKNGKFPKKKLGGRIKEFPKKNVPSPDASTSSQKIVKQNASKSNSVHKITEDSATVIQKNSLQTDDQDISDTESEISVGGTSFVSVSSVHTSDLSSFDDEISLSSDDEDGKKKKVSLKLIQERLSEIGKLDSSTVKKIDAKTPKLSESKVSVNKAARNITESVSIQSVIESGLSKRARKPNSRYSSDTILCTVVKVKERKKPISVTDSLNEKMSRDELSPQHKKSKVDNDIIGDVATITQSINNERNNNMNDVKTPIKLQTPDLYKSHSASRSLTSRRTAPVTLFST